jgi:hypothetical protein
MNSSVPAPATNSTTAPAMPEGLRPIMQEIITYRRELPRLLAEGHEGRVVLIKGDQVLSIWDTLDDAYQAARERFPLGQAFLTQPIDERDLHRVFPEELTPSKAN